MQKVWRNLRNGDQHDTTTYNHTRSLELGNHGLSYICLTHSRASCMANKWLYCKPSQAHRPKSKIVHKQLHFITYKTKDGAKIICFGAGRTAVGVLQWRARVVCWGAWLWYIITYTHKRIDSIFLNLLKTQGLSIFFKVIKLHII